MLIIFVIIVFCSQEDDWVCERMKDYPFQEIQEGTWSEQLFDSHWLLKAIMFSDDWFELLAEDMLYVVSYKEGQNQRFYKQCVNMIVIFFLTKLTIIENPACLKGLNRIQRCERIMFWFQKWTEEKWCSTSVLKYDVACTDTSHWGNGMTTYRYKNNKNIKKIYMKLFS